MRLTSFTDYAFRVLIYLALHPDRRVTIREISEAYGISRTHLMKVVNLLARQELVDAQRGPAGGLSLARAPAEIGVGEVVRKTEDELALVECFRGDNACRITPVCLLAGMLGKALKAFLAELDRWTLADVVANADALRGVLEVAE